MTWQRRDRPAIACWRASRLPPPRRKPAIPIRQLRFTTRSQRIRATDNILKGLATIQAATLRLDTADYAEMERRLNGLIEQGSPWRYSARELLGLSAYRLNKIPDAEKQFSALIADQGTPQNLRERADMMLALIVGKPQALSTTAK